MSERLPITKTYKLYLGGAFPRTESGRSMPIHDASGRVHAHLCQASRKDFRNAVRAARSASSGWAARSAYNRGQILYRMAEMLEGKAQEFADALEFGRTAESLNPQREVHAAVDRLLCFAGWADKFAQVVGSQNPVEGPFHNFSLPQPSGVCVAVAPDAPPLLGLISLLAPALCAGNSVIALGSEAQPLATGILGEVCATSDIPAGVVNLLTGKRGELLEHFASHRDVDVVFAASCTSDEKRVLELGAAENLKRVHVLQGEDWLNPSRWHSPELLEAAVEIKTLWHPSAT